MIFNPTLSPKKGYVEVEKNGERVYKKIQNKLEEETKLLKEENELLKTQIKALSDNQTFLEDCLIEVGQVVYA